MDSGRKYMYAVQPAQTGTIRAAGKDAWTHVENICIDVIQHMIYVSLTRFIHSFLSIVMYTIHSTL